MTKQNILALTKENNYILLTIPFRWKHIKGFSTFEPTKEGRKILDNCVAWHRIKGLVKLTKSLPFINDSVLDYQEFTPEEEAKIIKYASKHKTIS